MGDKKRTEEWYEKINKQFEEDSRTHDFSNPELDKWFMEMLDSQTSDEEKKRAEEWYKKFNKQFEEDSKTHDFSNQKLDKWFIKMLDNGGAMKDRKRTEEWYAKINSQFESDRKNYDYSDSDMDKWFGELLDKRIRQKRRSKIAKITSIAAGVVLLTSVLLNGFTQITYGESLFDIIRNSIKAGRFSITALGQID